MGNPLRHLLIALLPLLILQASMPDVSPGDRKVLIRIDDLQDFNNSEEQQTILRYHLDNRIPVLLATIPTRFGYDDPLLRLIKEGHDRGLFEVALHGWKHESMVNQSLSQQSLTMRYGKNLLTRLGIETRAFVPPLNEFDDKTLQAMKKNGLTVISSATYVGDTPKLEDGILHLPSTVTTAEVDFATDSWILLPLESLQQQAGRSWNEHGIAVVVIHPRQFLSPEGVWEDNRWQAYLEFLVWLRQRGAEFYAVDAPPAALLLDWDSLTLSVILFVGISSTILFALHIDPRRRKRDQSDGRPEDPPPNKEKASQGLDAVQRIG